MCVAIAQRMAILDQYIASHIFSLCSAKYISAVSSRGVTHGLSLLGLFIYKYIADTSFVTVSCRTSIHGLVSELL